MRCARESLTGMAHPARRAKRSAFGAGIRLRGPCCRRCAPRLPTRPMTDFGYRAVASSYSVDLRGTMTGGRPVTGRSRVRAASLAFPRC
jgi:hypothetical protein